MGATTEIGWTDHTFNPWWGCAPVSPGCDHCYAETFSKRVGSVEWGRETPRRFFGEKHWLEPVRWNAQAAAAGRRPLVFCASMADVFEDRQDLDSTRARLFELIEATPWLVWQLLTKRVGRVAELVPSTWLAGSWPENAWIGTTVEDQARANVRIPRLLDLPAPIRFLSCEPLLGPVHLRSEWIVPEARYCGAPATTLDGRRAIATVVRAAGQHLGGRYVDWVIVGGESGARFRPMSHAHAVDLGRQVVEAGIPLYFKQWGGLRPKAGGRLLDLGYGAGPVEYSELPSLFQPRHVEGLPPC